VTLALELRPPESRHYGSWRERLETVARLHGPGAVRAILGRVGLFSTSSSGVKLACTQYCDLHSSTKYAWPVWSHDAWTPRKIEAAKLAALRSASG